MYIKVTGKRAAKRVINGRLDPAVRNTLGIKWTPVGEEGDADRG